MGRLGIVGTLVWDTIHALGEREPVTDWGGIAYSLAAFEAAAPPGWEAVPIIKVGADLRREADRFLSTLGRLASLEHVVTVAEPNNRVDLFYHDRSRRCERLVGGVPGWSWHDLARPALSCDALYVNFIAGWELDLQAALALSKHVSAPKYCDVHSLSLAVVEDGMREPRPLERRSEWLGAFDLVQVNEDELETLSDAGPDRAARTTDLLADGPDAVFVTLGPGGAEWSARPDSRWVAPDGADGHGRAAAPAMFDFDPTGCGDVWGVSCFSALLSGARLGEAVGNANRIAASCARCSGTADLADRLKEERLTETGGDPDA